jgi:hypothetical protein
MRGAANHDDGGIFPAMGAYLALSIVPCSSRMGQSGVLTSAAILGVTVVDALTVSVARGAAKTVSSAVAAQAIASGVLANTALMLGPPR